VADGDVVPLLGFEHLLLALHVGALDELVEDFLVFVIFGRRRILRPSRSDRHFDLFRSGEWFGRGLRRRTRGKKKNQYPADGPSHKTSVNARQA
jgi:hypothetical protein